MNASDRSSEDTDVEAIGTGEIRDSTRVGHAHVDAVLDSLERDSTLPPAEQIAGYDAAHRTLQEILVTIDDGQS